MRNRLFRISTSLLIVVTLFTAGCRPAAEAAPSTVSPPNPAGATASVTIDSVNYMHDRGVKYTVYDLSRTPPVAVGGAIVVMLATGGEKGCCLALPKVWRAGMKVRVEWDESDRERSYPEKYSRDLEIPRYDTPAGVYVVFYPVHKVELVVSAAEPGHPDWRGSIKKTPWEQCVETNGRKPCKAALPKQFDTGSYLGFCPEALKEKWINAKENCEVLQLLCMRDYEDEAFCKNILWSEQKK